MTYADLKAQLDALTPEQLAADVIWSGDERGGKVLNVWIAEEDWIVIGDYDDCEPRSAYADFKDSADEDERNDYARSLTEDATIPKGTVHLMVDE